MSGRDGAKRRHEPKLVEGAYDHLVTRELERALDGRAAPDEPTAMLRVEAELDDADAHVTLARHLAGELERALASLALKGRAEQARALTTGLLEQLAALQADEEDADALREQTVVAPARRLVALYRGAPPELPSTPLGTSTLLTRNRKEPALGHELGRELALADRVDAIIAFITVGGVRSIEEELHRFARKPGAKLRILTTIFGGITQVAALDMIARLPGAEVRVSYDTQRTRLHAKAWLFHRDTGLTTAYVGSANLTNTALGAGQEWMVKVARRDLPHVIDKFEGTFETLWAEPEFERYDPTAPETRARIDRALATQQKPAAPRFLVSLYPRPFQLEILDRLAAERSLHGRHRNLVVAATGTGKTVIAALDYARLATQLGTTPRLLFLAHRKELLEQARRTFQYALQDASFGELLDGDHQLRRFDHVFATIQTARGLVERLGRDHFRHVIVDECHHMPADSYQEVVPQLTPQVLVGLTATPERSDGRSLLPDFDGHIAAELRLWHALDGQLLVPFEYFGISDSVDLKRVKWSRAGYHAGALGELYTGHEARADLIRHQLARRVADVREIRALGFCVSVEHAEYMAARFSVAGIPALAVHGKISDELRDAAPQKLRDREVNVLFTCDLYNEGVDLPFVDVLLFLRPTQSSTLFLQQLGRGLRHAPGKTSCLVLDFIGQHREEFRFDAILAAITGIARPRLRAAVEDGFPYLPSGCSLRLDPVAREQVLKALKKAVAGATRLAAELRELAAQDPGSPPRLARFLEETGRELGEVYGAGGWTTLKRKAGVLEGVEQREASRTDERRGRIDEQSESLGRLLHIDEPARLRDYRERVAQARGAIRAREGGDLDELTRRRLHMLGYQLNPHDVLASAEETLRQLTEHPSIADEFEELTMILEDRVALAEHSFPVPEWSLALHRHYRRREIITAVGYIGEGDKGIALQTGVLKLPETNDGVRRELLFVTLDKSGKSFSPTTRYRDYASSPTEFHWETQAIASVSRPSGKRYVEPAQGWQFFLFVRTDPEAAYAFLGRVHYRSHSGDRPISIVWRLEQPMPAALYDRYATLRP